MRRSPPALCLGHPGHEVKVLGWITQQQPVVTILTDGSGPDRVSRLDSTRKVLEEAGCQFGSLFGGMTDREIYALMREGAAPFVALAECLEKEWAEQGVTTVVGDALEGFSPTHDVCRMMINAVVQRTHQERSWKNYSFPLEKPVHAQTPQSLIVPIDDTLLQWKRKIIFENYPELKPEITRLVEAYGEAPFRQEILEPEVLGKEGLLWKSTEPPFYETYGSRQIDKGHYQELITYRDHLLPIAEGLWQWATS